MKFEVLDHIFEIIARGAGEDVNLDGKFTIQTQIIKELQTPEGRKITIYATVASGTEPTVVYDRNAAREVGVYISEDTSVRPELPWQTVTLKEGNPLHLEITQRRLKNVRNLVSDLYIAVRRK